MEDDQHERMESSRRRMVASGTCIPLIRRVAEMTSIIKHVEARNDEKDEEYKRT